MPDLNGLTVAITRAEQQGEETVAKFQAAGANALSVPVIDIEHDTFEIDRFEMAVKEGGYDWLVLTSANAVQSVAAKLPDLELSGQVAAVGAATAKAVEECGVKVDLISKEYVSEALAKELIDQTGGKEQEVLLPRADDAHHELPTALANAGWVVQKFNVYKKNHLKLTDEQKDLVSNADAIIFTSPSTVQSTLESMKASELPKLVACIGPVTSATARDHGIDVGVEPSEHTIEGLIGAIASHD